MASDFEKPDRVHTLFTHEIEAKLWPLPVKDLFTVGRATAEKLMASRIHTIGELAATGIDRLRAMFGTKMGDHLLRFANGVDESPVLAETEEAKGYSNSTTLATDVVSTDQAHRVILALADSVASRMRNDHCRASCVAVTIRGNDFHDRSHQKTLPAPTDITSEIFETAKKLQLEVLPLVNALFSQVNPIPAKAAVSAMGYGKEILRLPLTPMEEPMRSVLFEEMRKLGVRV
jgi:DNA polymerase-4